MNQNSNLIDWRQLKILNTITSIINGNHFQQEGRTWKYLKIYLYFLFFSLFFSFLFPRLFFLFFPLCFSRDWEMSSEGCREASVFETGKGAVRERISFTCQPWHSGMQGTYFHRYWFRIIVGSNNDSNNMHIRFSYCAYNF